MMEQPRSRFSSGSPLLCENWQFTSPLICPAPMRPITAQSWARRVPIQSFPPSPTREVESALTARNGKTFPAHQIGIPQSLPSFLLCVRQSPTNLLLSELSPNKRKRLEEIPQASPNKRKRMKPTTLLRNRTRF